MSSKLMAQGLFTDEDVLHIRLGLHNAPFAGIFHLETIKMDDESASHAAFKQNANSPAFVNMLEGIDCGTSDTHLALRPDFSLTSNLEVFTCIECVRFYDCFRKTDWTKRTLASQKPTN
ncbi:hypothetical protein CcaCcLH18_11315 [Colletotrichum camelliae]|nr:hypothetical protein CcaCcLH18_11315 [Colletotrichum camelliae]